MDWAGWALFGLIATAALTAVMSVAQLAGITRLDLPLLLGTITTEDPDRARITGFFIHLAIGVAFDGAPVFGRLVGGADAGTFRMGPTGVATVTDRCYQPDTTTLETTWHTEQGRLTLTKAMVAEVAGTLLPATLLVRRLSAEDGPVDAMVDLDPRLGERHRPPVVQHRGDVLVGPWGATAMAVCSSPSLPLSPGRSTTLTIAPGHPLTVAVAIAHREPLVYVDADTAWTALTADGARWRAWCDDIDNDLPHRDLVVRSLLTLRLLTYSPSGAPVAAPTTSLPELLGGTRNWDYRFAWPRDASIGISAFLDVGKVAEACRFLGWVFDAAWPLVRAGHGLYSETWRAMRGFADEVSTRWTEPDAGIWEVRGAGGHHLHSELMAWLALDRALRIAANHPTSRFGRPGRTSSTNPRRTHENRLRRTSAISTGSHDRPREGGPRQWTRSPPRRARETTRLPDQRVRPMLGDAHR